MNMHMRLVVVSLWHIIDSGLVSDIANLKVANVNYQRHSKPSKRRPQHEQAHQIERTKIDLKYEEISDQRITLNTYICSIG